MPPKREALFGKNPITEALKAGKREIHELIVLDSFKNDKAFLEDPLFAPLFTRGKIKFVSKPKLDDWAKTSHHQGMCAFVSDFVYADFDELLAIQKNKETSLFVICDSITDPQNFGAICRSSLCFGVDGLIITKDRSVEVTATVVKASAGSVEHLSIARVTNLKRAIDEMKEASFWIYASDSHAEKNLGELQLPPKRAVVMGNEGEGIRRLTRESCDDVFKIPMKGNFDSLNVASALSVILYEFQH